MLLVATQSGRRITVFRCPFSHGGSPWLAAAGHAWIVGTSEPVVVTQSGAQLSKTEVVARPARPYTERDRSWPRVHPAVGEAMSVVHACLWPRTVDHEGEP